MSMLKGYVSRWKMREKPEEHIMDYWFDSHSERGACWSTRQDAENDCTLFKYHHIQIPSSEGGKYVCKDFKVEERAPNEFVVYCIAPFVLETSGQGEKQ